MLVILKEVVKIYLLGSDVTDHPEIKSDIVEQTFSSKAFYNYVINELMV